MVHCEKGHENPEGALFCKECGQILNSQEVHDTIEFRFTLKKLNPLVYLFFFLGLNPLIVFMVVCIILFFKFNKRWKKFFIIKNFDETKAILKKYVFSINKIDEKIIIKENSKGELKLKDKSLGAKGYFHLVTDKEGNVLLIGEKYNTQNLIRTVFGKDINFIEK